MVEKMTWEERRNMHINEWDKHRKIAKAVLAHMIECGFNHEEWEEYKRESMLANRHWGYAEAMWTRKHGN